MELPERLTASDFLTWLATKPGDATYELIDGKVQRAETGSTMHGQLIDRLSDLFAPSVRARRCRKYASSMTVECANGDVPVPDIVVTCDERDRPSRLTRAVLFPCLVVEVLSPSTATADLKQKADAYCGTPSVQEYLLVDSTRRWAVVWRRNTEGDFVRHPGFGSLRLATLDLSVDLDDLYGDLIEA